MAEEGRQEPQNATEAATYRHLDLRALLTVVEMSAENFKIIGRSTKGFIQ